MSGKIPMYGIRISSEGRIPPMTGELDDETQQTPEEPRAKALGGEEQQGISEDEKPGAADLLKAAKEGAKRLKKLEP
jgi:hypothetical protein